MQQSIYQANGKLLLTSEYYVLDGACALALPTRFEQQLRVSSTVNYEHSLLWQAYDYQGKCWLKALFALPDCTISKCAPNYRAEAEALQAILQHLSELNPHFLPTQPDQPPQLWQLKTHLTFPRNWGLGSSSTLVSLLADLAHVDPFELNRRAFGGSGYDIACAKASQAIYYTLPAATHTPQISPAPFQPPFAQQLYFVHLGSKKDTRQGISHYRQQPAPSQQLIGRLSAITQAIAECTDLHTFEQLLTEHEAIIAQNLQLTTAKDTHFADYTAGVIKSLGAWGGDFVLATAAASLSATEVRAYFAQKGFDTVLTYADMVL